MEEELNLLSAIEQQDLGGVLSLLQRGADPNTPETNLGLRPVHFAALHKCPEILRELVSRGAALDDFSPCLSSSPSSSSSMISVLQFCVQGYVTHPEECLAMIRILIGSGRLQRDVLGQSLQFACGMGYTAVVQLLLEGNADPNYFPEDDEYQMTPLIGMIFENEPCEGHPEILHMLIRAGGNLHQISAGMSAHDYAVNYQRDDLIPILNQFSWRT